MTDSDRTPQTQDVRADAGNGEGAPAAANGSAQPAGEAAAGARTREEAGPDPRIAELEAQVADLRDQVLRAMAETDNVRKRTQREIEDTRKYAVGNMAKELLPVADSLRLALGAAPADPDPAMKNFLAGVEATERQLVAAFEKVGITRMDPLGQPADPNFHQIMMEVDGGGAAPLTVVQVLQDGYLIHDRLLRAALVAVAKRDGGGDGQVKTNA